MKTHVCHCEDLMECMQFIFVYCRTMGHMGKVINLKHSIHVNDIMKDIGDLDGQANSN